MRGILGRLGRLLAEDDPTAADVRSMLDIAYQQHLQALTGVRRTAARLGALGRRLDIHLARLEEVTSRVAGMAERSSGQVARSTGAPDDLRALAERHASLLAQREALQTAGRRLAEDEQRISAAADAFRVQRFAILGTAESPEARLRGRRLAAETAAEIATVEASLESDRALADQIAEGLRQAGDVPRPAIGPEPGGPRFEQPPGPDAPPAAGADLR